jgi:hypothetical protein
MKKFVHRSLMFGFVALVLFGCSPKRKQSVSFRVGYGENHIEKVLDDYMKRHGFEGQKNTWKNNGSIVELVGVSPVDGMPKLYEVRISSVNYPLEEVILYMARDNGSVP